MCYFLSRFKQMAKWSPMRGWLFIHILRYRKALKIILPGTYYWTHSTGRRSLCQSMELELLQGGRQVSV